MKNIDVFDFRKKHLNKVLLKEHSLYFTLARMRPESNICTGDIESELMPNGEWLFKMISVITYNKILVFYDLTECFDYLNKGGLTIHFHNLDFDLLFFIRNSDIMKTVRDAPLITSGNKILSFTIGSVCFKNSLAILPMSLAKVVKVFLKINDYKYEKDKQNVVALSDEDLEPYCIKDSLYLYFAIYKITTFFKENYNVNMGLTIPSTSFKVYKKHFCYPSNFLDIKHRNSGFFNEGYYYGGHTEKFVNNQYVFRNVYYYDVNSLYPDRMHDVEFGCSKLERDHPTKRKLQSLYENKELFFAEIMVNIDSEELRFFPVLDAEKSMNRYPKGIFPIKISEIGLEFILKYGSWDNVLKVKQLLTYEDDKKFKPFEKFVSTFFKLRKSDLANDVIYKLLLNSLYGKFGEKLTRDGKYFNVTKEHETEPSIIQPFGENVLTTFKEESPFYNKFRNRLDVCGKITESSRLKMGNIINDLRKEGKVYYTDTDSVITSVDLNKSAKLNCLLDSKKLGFLSDEIGYKDNAIILGTKMYCFYKSRKSATKGIKEMSLENFKEIVRGRTSFSNKRFTKLHTLVNRGFFGIQQVPYNISTILERLD